MTAVPGAGIGVGVWTQTDALIAPTKTRRKNIARMTVRRVLGFGVANGAPAVRIDRMGPDNYWFGARPQILDRRGAGVDEMIAQVCAAVASYPYPNSYVPGPGPTAIPSSPTSPGRSPTWRSSSRRMRSARISCRAAVCSAPHPAGPGLNYRSMESSVSCSPPIRVFKVNLLGLNLGVDPVRPALKLPALGRLGMVRL